MGVALSPRGAGVAVAPAYSVWSVYFPARCARAHFLLYSVVFKTHWQCGAQQHYFFVLFYRTDGKMKIFLLFSRFGAFWGRFARVRQFAISVYEASTYLKKSSSPTPLQRLPRLKTGGCEAP